MVQIARMRKKFLSLFPPPPPASHVLDRSILIIVTLLFNRKYIDEAMLHQDNADEKALANRLKLETKKETQRIIKLADMQVSNMNPWTTRTI